MCSQGNSISDTRSFPGGVDISGTRSPCGVGISGTRFPGGWGVGVGIPRVQVSTGVGIPRNVGLGHRNTWQVGGKHPTMYMGSFY